MKALFSHSSKVMLKVDRYTAIDVGTDGEIDK